MIGDEAWNAFTREQRNKMWYWRAVAGLNVSEDKSEKRQMKAFKKCLKHIAKEDGVKKKEVLEGLREHYDFMKHEQWMQEMQRKFPPPTS
jgi:hypothetical protein